MNWDDLRDEVRENRVDWFGYLAAALILLIALAAAVFLALWPPG